MEWSGKEYLVCDGRDCSGTSWLWANRLQKKSYCKECGRAWEATYHSSGVYATWHEETPKGKGGKKGVGAKPQTPKGFQTNPKKTSAFEPSSTGAAAPVAAKPEDGPEAWKQWLRYVVAQQWGQMPQEFQQQLSEVIGDPQETNPEPNPSQQFKVATNELRRLGTQKTQLQTRIDKAKTSLQDLLVQMKDLQAQLAEAQQKVDQASKVYWEQVLDMAKPTLEGGAGPTGADVVTEIMATLGDKLTPEQKTKLAQLAGVTREEKRRKKEKEEEKDDDMHNSIGGGGLDSPPPQG